MEPEPEGVTIVKGNFLACTTSGDKARCNSVSVPRTATPRDILDADERSFHIGEFDSIDVNSNLVNKFGSLKNTFSMDFSTQVICTPRMARGKRVLDCNEQ